MQLPNFLTTASLALTATAVLVPPDVTDAEFFDAADGVMIAESHKSLTLECNPCPAAVGNQNGRPMEWIEGLNTELVMDFAVKGSSLTMNGRPFYPRTPETAVNALYVKQKYAGKEDDAPAMFDGQIPISMGVEVHPQVQLTSVKFEADGLGPVTQEPARRLSFEILGLADKVVKVDTLEILISESDDNLKIFNVGATPYSQTSTPESDACKTVLCRVRATIRAKLAQWRQKASATYSKVKEGCARKIQTLCGGFRMPTPAPHKFHGFKGMPKLKGGLPKFSGDSTFSMEGKKHHSNPWAHQGHGGFGKFGHHHHHHSAIRGVVRFFKHVITPIFIGVAAGMAVSGIGMIIGQIAVLLWLRARGIRRSQYEGVEQSETRDSFDELPKYEEAPAYEDYPVDEKKDVREE